jgi:hypothetical protein
MSKLIAEYEIWLEKARGHLRYSDEKLAHTEPDIESWKRIRELRNFSVHESAGESINRDVKEILTLSMFLLDGTGSAR